jgi:HSP20 family protein
MNTLTKTSDQARSPSLWDPFAGFAEMRRQMDELMAAAFGSRRPGNNAIWQPATEITEDERQFTIAIEVPGMEDKDITVEVDGNLLTVRGERQGTKREGSDSRPVSSERWYGAFARALTLPPHADAEHISARVDKGLLTVVVPKHQQEPPKRIAVTRGEGGNGSHANRAGTPTSATTDNAPAG